MKKIIPFLFLLATLNVHAQWTELGGAGSSGIYGPIAYICTDAAGNLYAGGAFPNNNNNYFVAKWTKANNKWGELGGNNSLQANDQFYHILVDNTGNVYAAGKFTNSSNNCYVAEWTKATNTWSELGGTNSLAANDKINALWLDAAGNIYAGGNFTNSSGKCYVAKWNGTKWSELGGNNSLTANSGILTICTDPSGNVYAAGAFTNASNQGYVAEWNGTKWSEVGGTNALSPNGQINSICSDKFGNIYAGGGVSFGPPRYNRYIAKWDGTNWSALEGTDSLEQHTNSLFLSANIVEITFDPSGNLYAVGSFDARSYSQYNIAKKWDGTSWTTLNTQSFPNSNNGQVNGAGASITFDNTGDVFIAAGFNNLTNYQTVAENTLSALPIRLTSFSAETQNTNVLLQWQTAQEENSDYFTIQRSIDGNNFTNIAKVSAAGNSSVTKNYSFTDENAASINSNIFYRIAETDIDGALTYSDVRRVNFNKTSLQFSVYPNPAKDFVNIVASMNMLKVVLKVVDLSGRTLYKSNQSFTAGQQIQLNTSQFPKEVLIISVGDNNNRQEFKIVNQ